MVRKLVPAACCIAIVACAAKPAQYSGTPEKQHATVMPDSKHDQILALEQKIDADRGTLQLAEPMETDYQGSPAEPLGAMPATQDPKCRPAKTETCTTSCTLSDSICNNADSICRLAVEINDDWARGRCAKANKTCDASRTKCCGCQ